MKRHLNTSYRLVWNHITGAFVVASELARSRGKRAGVAVALSLAAATSLPAPAADTVVQAGETVSGGTLINHDRQTVSGTADGVTVSTGLELGPDSDDNTGGQQITPSGTARNTTVTADGLQDVMAGGSATDTVISAGGGQNLRGQASGTVLNGGEQWIHAGGSASGTVINRDGYQTIKHGGLATGTIVNTGAEGGPDSENVSTGQMVGGTAESTTINKNGRQVIWSSGLARDTLIYAGGDQTVHGEAHNTRLEGGNQYVHKDGLALNTVINDGGWQVVKEGAVAENTTVNQKGRLQVNAGGKATDVTQNTGSALVTSTAATVTGTNRLGVFSVVEGKADNVVLENGGRLDVLSGHTATNTHVDEGGTLDVRSGGTATTISMGDGGVLLADSGAAVSGTRSDGTAFRIGGGQADALMLGKGSAFTLNAGDTATDTTVNGGQLTAHGGILEGTTTLNNGATLTLSGKTVNNDTLTIREGDALLQGGALTGNGSVEKSGSGTLTVSNTTLTQKAVNLNEGTLTLNNSTVTTDVTAQRGTALKLTGSTVLNGAIDPTNVTLASGATWNIPDNATVQSVVDDLSHAGQIHFTSTRTGKFVPATLKVKNLNGQNGTISLRVRPDMAQNNADRLVIDGGRATGKTILNLVNAGNSASGLATTGKGIRVVEAINGATTEEGAFVQGNRLQAGAFNYSLNLDREIWRDLMQRSGILSLMDAQARDTWYRSLEYDNFPEISEANILSTFEQLHQNKDEVFERGVINVFRGLSWNYKTNCPCKFGSKIIVNNLVRWDRWGFHLITGQQTDRVADLERMLHLFSGNPIPDNRENIIIRLDEHIQSVQGKTCYEDEMFSIRYFKKGSAHITFRKPELIDRLNDIIAKYYPEIIPYNI
ncbi:DUF4942 domain-containing protein [Escherichia coli]|nr:DUF4942 domain-containing protein [Escherichia coli]